MVNQEHFQKILFQEIIHGIATSCEGYMLEGKEMIEAAANIYLNLIRQDEQLAKEETELISEWKTGEFIYTRISKCKKCDHTFARYVADNVQFCPGCGRRIMEKKRR